MRKSYQGCRSPRSILGMMQLAEPGELTATCNKQSDSSHRALRWTQQALDYWPMALAGGSLACMGTLRRVLRALNRCAVALVGELLAT